MSSINGVLKTKIEIHAAGASKAAAAGVEAAGGSLVMTVPAKIQADGLTFDYNILKDALKELCDSLDELVLMPASSPHIKIDSDDRYTYVLFADERIPFLQRDLKLLPVRNISVEELAHYLLERLTVHPDILRQDITTLVLKCASGAGQWASATWQSKEHEFPPHKGILSIPSNFRRC